MTRILRIFADEKAEVHAAQAPALRVAPIVSVANHLNICADPLDPRHLCPILKMINDQ